MPYPTRYTPQTNFPREEELGGDISTTAMQAEYARIADSISQIVTALRAIMTSDGRLKLDQAVRARDVITELNIGTGDGVTTTFTLPIEIDAAVDMLRTYVNDVRTDAAMFTDTEVTFAVAPAGGAEITGFLYMNLAGVLDRLQSVVQDEGASLVGIEDLEGLYDATNVEDALAELAGDLAALESALGDLGGYVLRDGSRTLTGQWEVNERSTTTIAPAVSVGSFQVNLQPTAGQYVVIPDGAYTQTFEFGSALQAGAIQVAIGATREDSIANLLAAINASPLAVKAEVSGQVFTLTNEIPRALGNVPINASGAAFNSLSGMGGGVDGSFSATYRTHYRVRNHPRSLRDGDVVVHEQLNEISATIASTLTSFLRTDGGNQMVGILNMGGQRIINSADATTATGLTTKQQMEAAIVAAGESKLSLVGTKDTVAEGTLTGPVRFGQLAASVADVDQTTTPATVSVPTLGGVAKPAAGDQVANKLYVDDAIAALVIGESTGFAAFNVEGDGLGGAGLASMVPGGEFYFEDLVIAAAQALTMPTRIYCEGTFTLQNTGSITSTAPVEIIAVGGIVINGPIQCPHLTLRGGSTLAVTAAISSHASVGTYFKDYPYVYPSTFGYPMAVGATNLVEARHWRAILIDIVGAISITAALTSDDIFIKGGGDVVITSTVTALWYVGTGWTTTSGSSIGWNDGYKDYSAMSSGAGHGPGGTGGTGGGTGTGTVGTAGGNSIFKGGNRPYLLPNYALARGGQGARNAPGGTPAGDGLHGKGGGRISVYADGNLTLTAAAFIADGGDGDEIFGGGADGGGGGGGSVRLACKGVMTDGSIDADGGESVDGSAGAGGGLAAMIASGYAGTQSRSAVGADTATAGTSVAVTLPADTIDGLKQQRLFEVLPDG